MRATTADDYWLGKGRQAACAALTGLALRATSQRGSTTAAAGQANGTLAAGCYRRGTAPPPPQQREHTCSAMLRCMCAASQAGDCRWLLVHVHACSLPRLGNAHLERHSACAAGLPAAAAGWLLGAQDHCWLDWLRHCGYWYEYRDTRTGTQ
jgi:hypothetical protein